MTARPRRRRPGPRPARAGTRSRSRPTALTGTPGTGKSAVGRRLSGRWSVAEVAELAVAHRAARRLRPGLEVDLARLRRVLRRPGALDGVDLVVGHLAHLLPVREAIVLRCRPVELARRLRRARRGTARERAENFASEALDQILVEAAATGVPVFEIDTTGRSVAAVAREVARRLARGGAPRHGKVDWLADRAVTAQLMDGTG